MNLKVVIAIHFQKWEKELAKMAQKHAKKCKIEPQTGLKYMDQDVGQSISAGDFDTYATPVPLLYCC